MDIDYANGQVLLRALRWHDRRMQEIANRESQLGKNDQASVAFDEARFARDMAEKLSRGGGEDLSYENGQLLMRALRSYSTHIIRHTEGANLVRPFALPAQVTVELEHAAVELLLAELAQNGIRIQ